ncbi:DUF2807 domain-containing protein [Flavihumibacter rivuli]|uniref:head GIN domain-containing protein n=1 Tax=Flavihumibacter rivuli TaxID=2838156 RepID=UPI001BDE29EC|nr:head GIN domain-containing protein [Flavihumibacter rivuli]ULQ56684.1 DUF2807 domain-containing protein [Flavihumibacter rivuli]
MKKIIVLGLSLLVAVSMQAQKFIINDSNAKLRQVGSFTGVKVSSAIDTYISQGEENAVAVSASDESSRDRIRTEVKDGVLHVWFDAKGWTDWRGNKRLKAYISVREINLIKADGACDVKLMGKVKTDKLVVDLSGASDIEGELECKELNVDVSGASDIKLKGSVGNINLSASGASSLKGYDLVTDYLDVDASGASSVYITVNKEMKVKASGASDIKYKGPGVIRDMKSSGASSISRKDG